MFESMSKKMDFNLGEPLKIPNLLQQTVKYDIMEAEQGRGFQRWNKFPYLLKKTD